MGEDARPYMSVTMGSVEVVAAGSPDDTLDDVREQFDHAYEKALEGAGDLHNVGPL